MLCGPKLHPGDGTEETKCADRCTERRVLSVQCLVCDTNSVGNHIKCFRFYITKRRRTIHAFEFSVVSYNLILISIIQNLKKQDIY